MGATSLSLPSIRFDAALWALLLFQNVSIVRHAMTHADFDPDSASTDSANGPSGISGSIQPPPPVVPEAPSVPSPPQFSTDPASADPAPADPAAMASVPPLAQGPANDRHDRSRSAVKAVVPPPPPPRSTLPPVRSVSDGKVPSGVGSAKGLRWRGELPNVSEPKQVGNSKPSHPPEQLSDPGDGDYRWGAPPWLISLVIHLILLLVLALITTPVGSGIGKLMLTVGTSDGEPSVELSDFEIAADDTLVESETLVENAFEVDTDLPALLEPILEETMTVEMTDLVPILAGQDAGEIGRPMFSGRTGAMKAALLAKYGGTGETQEAVKRGLEWLKRNQTKKGGWSMKGPYRDGNHSENQASATAMALLAFLGDGHTHRSGDYVNEVERGMKFLVSLQNRSGFVAKEARGHEQMYSQAQATIALCELYGMTKDSWLRPRAELAVDFAVKAQSPQGGWRYQPNQDSDTSVTGWFLLSLMSAQSAGLEVNDSAIRQIGKYLDTAEAYEGAAYAYQPRGAPTPAMTAEGLLCRQYLGWNREDVPMVRGVEALAMDYPFDVNDQDVYYWYYATQMLHHFGGAPWTTWNDIMKVKLPEMQARGGREDGSWAPQGDAYGSYGRIYTTCLSIYCLEVYYRHMPLYQ